MPQYVLGLDPGSKNFAYSVIAVRQDGAYRVVESGMFQNTISDLKIGTLMKIRRFQWELEQIINKYQISRIVAERFMARGLAGGASEAIGIMLGLIGNSAEKDFVLLTSASWKNAFNRRWVKKEWSLNDYYKERPHGTPLHIIDASLIGIYYVEKHLFKKTPFVGFETQKRRNRIMCQICR